MVEKNDKIFERLIGDVKKTVLLAQDGLDNRGIKISEVELELKTIAKKGIEGGIDLEFPMIGIKLDASGKRVQEDINSIKISLVPKPPDIKLFSSPQERLNNMVESIFEAVDEAVRAEPSFILAEAIAELNFAVTDEGNLDFSLFAKAGGEINREAIQTMKLKLKGPGKKE